MSGRTRPSAATKRASAFTHAIVVWLRRKVLLEWLTRIAVKTHASTGTLFCLEWRATRLRWCKNGTIHHSKCPDCSQGGPLILRRSDIHRTKAGSHKL